MGMIEVAKIDDSVMFYDLPKEMQDELLNFWENWEAANAEDSWEEVGKEEFDTEEEWVDNARANARDHVTGSNWGTLKDIWLHYSE